MKIEYILLIILMAVVTYLTRVSFLVLFTSKNLPTIIYRALKYIPVAIFATLIFPGIFAPQGKLDLSLTNPYIGASFITVVSLLIGKNAILSIVLGITSLVVLRYLL
ncbi:branched-chain amino acid transporter AzlD [Carboxydothermus islandicus]|uniref:Branched-chain amino acid transporter AzlD n=1 Tax=Carboxydothermus islandicus TaxID=661089 RepID=A0A1L8D242_9THEO|nr:AzlD domain-containing protein [Carboxydothermus islandicus]GAV25265.1 branched-chain amino acid transporter AzlD [Carboxydothermus islandicus]